MSERDLRREAAHIDELAELYALGALESTERTAVEAHVATCATCARALSEAETTVAALDDAFMPRVEPPARLAARIAASAAAFESFAPPRQLRPQPRQGATRGMLAAAASLVFIAGATGSALVEHAADTRRAALESSVLATIASSHFLHVSFTPRDHRAPVSKALFARDGSWVYVVVASSACDCHVVVHSGSLQRDLGPPQIRGTTATLFAREVARVSSIDLIDATGRVVTSAALRYPPAP